jgi:transcriptional antiterminator NusG
MENTQQEKHDHKDEMANMSHQNIVEDTDSSSGEKKLRLLSEYYKEIGQDVGKTKSKTEVKDDEPRWFSLRVISGKEKKIQERIAKEIEQDEDLKSIIFKVIVPTEKVYKVRNGKKVMQERNLLPGYILIEALGSKLQGDVAKFIADIPNVIHFLGKENPLPMSQIEANRLLGVVDESAEVGETLSEPFLVNETVKIIDGPFAEFIGDVKEVNEEKKKLKVIVKIFGRGTEVELNFLQVEKIS